MHKYTGKYIKKYYDKYTMVIKPVKLDQEVHERLKLDKAHFTETIGYRFTLSDTVREYQKILNGLVDKKPPLKNSPRLPLETSEDKQTCDFNEVKNG